LVLGAKLLGEAGREIEANNNAREEKEEEAARSEDLIGQE
jgi:hypothetical protein